MIRELIAGKLGSKGQVSVTNLVMLAVAIMLFGVLVPVVQPFIDAAKNATSNTILILLLDFLLPAMLIGLLLVIFKYERPYREQFD